MMITAQKNRVDDVDEGGGDSDQRLNSNSSLSRVLPHDIILYDILTRIPIDIIGKFRCVCNSWYHLIIKDPVFIDLHSRRNYNPGFIMLSSHYKEFFNGDEMNDDDTEEEEEEEEEKEEEDRDDDDDYVVTKQIGIVFFDLGMKRKKVFRFRQETGLIDEPLKILHSLNGLVLMSCYDLDRDAPNYSLHVYNPITGCSIKLPPIVTERIYDELDCFLNLAYDVITEEYKVVCCGYNEDKKEYYCKIITVGISGSWRVVVFPRGCHLPNASNWRTVFANGCLHWLINVPGGRHFIWTNNKVISNDGQRETLSLDVSRESFYIIHFPKEASEVSTVHEIEGTLGYIDHLPDAKLKLWILKHNTQQQQQQYEWVEKCSFDMPPLFVGPFVWEYGCIAIVTYPELKMVYSSYHDRDEEHEQPFFKVHCYNVESKEVETVFEASGTTVAWFWHVNSLLSLGNK